jgi:hypothetical protein
MIMQMSKTLMVAFAVFLALSALAPRGIVGGDDIEENRCYALFLGALSGAAVIAAAEWPVNLLSFSDMSFTCFVSYLWCVRYFG